MLIRPAYEEDYDAIWGMLEATIATGKELAFRPGTPRGEALAGWVGRGKHTYVAEFDGEIVGSYVLKPNQPGLGSHVANGAFVVDPAHRGRGLGRAMAEDSIRRARALDFKAMQWNLVVADNEPAIALWRSLGFEIIGTLPGAFEAPDGSYSDAHVMFMRL
jgi:ribosomal protein S18 acetylase RimI-like enzyme